MNFQNKATRIELFSLKSVPMRTFHLTWVAFFLCFFAWFGIAPLMSVVRDEMKLTKDQVGWCIIGSVAITIVARLFIGWLCDRVGPRLTYSWLLVLGSLPVMGIGFARDFETFLMARVLIGMIGASFVITQYHTSIMFSPSCVGTASATVAGWGNLGGGCTQFAMPLIYGALIGTFGLSTFWGWRVAMFACGVICLLTGIAYYFFTQDAPDGNFADLRARGLMPAKNSGKGSFQAVCRDKRVWALALIYGACFGLELTMHNVAALYFADYFDEFKQLKLDDPLKAMQMAGLAAAGFGLMNLFTRPLGGIISDKWNKRWGLSGRVRWLFLTLFCEGLCLMLFSQMRDLRAALASVAMFAMFVQMSNGGTYSVVPFVNRKALGSVAGIVGAGGNLGAVAAGFLFKMDGLAWPTALLILGAIVTLISFSAFAVSFETEAEMELAPMPTPVLGAEAA